MGSKFLRQLTMLRHIPRSPAKTTTRVLKEVLEKSGYEVSQRTIQRDLKRLSAILPGLQVDAEKDFPGWSWSKGTAPQDIPAMNGNMALTFKLADHFLKTMFPPSILGSLKPYFDSAGNVLESLDSPGYSQWGNKVRIVSRTQPLMPANIDEDVVSTIYEALFMGRQFRGRYTKRSGDEVEYDLHPLSLIFRESVVYLVATVWDYQDPRHFALHRFNRCELLDKVATIPHEFNLDDYIVGGSFEYCETECATIHLKASFYDGAGQHLLETPLSSDQKTEALDDGSLQIEATVKDSAQLRWWLLGFGDRVEVIEPVSLRDEFAAVAAGLVDRYKCRI